MKNPPTNSRCTRVDGLESGEADAEEFQKFGGEALK